MSALGLGAFMDWKERCRSRLGGYLDARGDLAPPWERFPVYERYTIGWRMGSGEDWLLLWSVFLEQLGPDSETRMAYLRRHPPAPINWADTVHHVLHPMDSGDDEPDPDVAAGRRAALLAQGLIASDASYRIWLGQQSELWWPWDRHGTPESAARHNVREFWFWSRWAAELRTSGAWVPPAAPDVWASCAHALESGDAGPIDPEQGLLSLARQLCAGYVTAPWQVGLPLADFADSFADDMGCVDAFRLWGMSVFDDAEQLRRYLDEVGLPPEWEAWVAGQLPTDTP